MLSSLLHYADADPQTGRLRAEGGRAFVAMSLRPYLIAALLDRERERPAIVVAGDDRQARDLASSLRTWLAPRRVRYYPSRGVYYPSHHNILSKALRSWW
jgi:transcription-repair coupling factor (superfamily II helicase)